MIAIAIVAVLVSVAVPVYSGYKIRAKVSECVNNAAPVKFAVSEYRLTYGEWPPSLAATGKADSGLSHYCNEIFDYDTATGGFTIDVDEALIDPRLIKIEPQLVPTFSGGHAITWNCVPGNTDLDDIVYLPEICRKN